MRSDRARRFPEGIREPCLLTGLMGLTGCLALHVGMWRDSFFAVLLRTCCRTGSDDTARHPRTQGSKPADRGPIPQSRSCMWAWPLKSTRQPRTQGSKPAVPILHVGLALQNHPPTPQTRVQPRSLDLACGLSPSKAPANPTDKGPIPHSRVQARSFHFVCGLRRSIP